MRTEALVVALAFFVAVIAGSVIAFAAFIAADADARPTGDLDIDRTIRLAEQGDIDALAERVEFQSIACVRQPTDVPPVPPPCPGAAPEGTPVDVFMTGQCEGSWAPVTSIEGALHERLGVREMRAYAVLGLEELATVPTDHAVLLDAPGRLDDPSATILGLRDGRIVSAIGWCASLVDAYRALTAFGAEPAYVSEDLERLAARE